MLWSALATAKLQTGVAAWNGSVRADGMALGDGRGCGVAVGIAFIRFNNGMLPGQHPVRASVQSVDGSLYTGRGRRRSRLIPAGYRDPEWRRDPHGEGIDSGGAPARWLSGRDGRALGSFGLASMERHDDSSGWRAGHRAGRQAAFGAALCRDRRRSGFGERNHLFCESWDQGIARGRD